MTYRKLKPCPWCGEKVHLVGSDLDGFYIFDDNEECPRSVVVVYKTVKKAIKGWNEKEVFKNGIYRESKKLIK